MRLGLARLFHYCKNVKPESDYYNPEVLADHDNGEHFVGSETCRSVSYIFIRTHLEDGPSITRC